MEVSIEIEVADDVQCGGSVVDGDVSLILGCGGNGITFTGSKESISKLISGMKDAFGSMFPK